MQGSLKDLLAGLVFVAFGLAFAIGARNYGMGSALRMGPGYVPVALGGALVLLGVVIGVKGVLTGNREALGPIPWRGLILLLAALLFFGFTVRGLGLAPALFVTSFLSALASQRTGLATALVLAAALTLFCCLIFVGGLGLPLPLRGPWLTF
jgi:hypothetical protein